uniref:Variant surface glycoprotein 1125.4768 n=1 Tax=Trypanosoma brucei TaxID=5691 RepID=A0A1J0RB05_9TRYP|nr:variant surface glycoprotein 1125.4768 [Trypanosoma brucei]
MIRYVHVSSEYAIFAISKALALLLLAAQLGAATTTKNGKEFSVFCEIYKLCTSEPNTTDLTGSDTPEPPDDIEDLYIVTLPTVNFTAKKFSTFSDKAWEQKKKSLLEAQTPEAKPKYLRIGDEETRQRVHWAMEKIRTAAAETRKRLNDAQQAITALAGGVRSHLKQALTGDTNKETTDDSIYGKHANRCKKDSPAEQGASLASDLACLCSSASAANLCVAGGTVRTYKNSGGDTAGNAKTAVQTIVTKCPPSATQRHVTPSTIDAALSQFASLFGTAPSTGANTENVIGGGETNNDCDGQDEASACIDYNGVVRNKDITKLPLVGQLLAAQKLLVEAEKQRQQLDANKVILQGLQLQAATTHAILGKTPTSSPTAAGGESTTPDVTVECRKKSKGDCTGKCKWDGSEETKGTCKPKKVEGQESHLTEKVTGTGKKLGKCKGKLETECTKAPECKWDARE